MAKTQRTHSILRDHLLAAGFADSHYTDKQATSFGWELEGVEENTRICDFLLSAFLQFRTLNSSLRFLF